MQFGDILRYCFDFSVQICNLHGSVLFSLFLFSLFLFRFFGNGFFQFISIICASCYQFILG
ncbi:MAG TPA: hypothetical protein DCS36_11175 [Sphingobacterium sp.]|nr:hypothetical protein [Sphingobacterium sp.]HAF37307.1 hypothetical protein [Sphingobacterium sp.]HAL52461.1 hypothetical protein [Sphingobacterium sp.]HAT92926.1 hypothetical protein [Sphingobacterium sp.]HAU52226.1 hypothetical protein [Sphingobacterium sp.]